jgi:hypothetical protein
VGTIKIKRQVMRKKMKESKLQKGKVTGNHSSPECILRWTARNVMMTSTYHTAEVQTAKMRGKGEEETKACVCDSL